MNTAELLAAIDEVRHDVDAWDHNTTARTWQVKVGPFTLTVRPNGQAWAYDVELDGNVLSVLAADTASEGRRLALDCATLYVKTAQVDA